MSNALFLTGATRHLAQATKLAKMTLPDLFALTVSERRAARVGPDTETVDKRLDEVVLRGRELTVGDALVVLAISRGLVDILGPRLASSAHMGASGDPLVQHFGQRSNGSTGLESSDKGVSR